MNTYDEYVRRLKNAWKARDDEETQHEILPDGGKITVSMNAMDSVQRALAGDTPAISDGNQATLDAAQHNADRVQAFADHFTAKREAKDTAETPAHAAYVDHLNDAWQGVAA